MAVEHLFRAPLCSISVALTPMDILREKRVTEMVQPFIIPLHRRSQSDVTAPGVIPILKLCNNQGSSQ